MDQLRQAEQYLDGKVEYSSLLAGEDWAVQSADSKSLP
jgi:hypothetical protein